MSNESEPIRPEDATWSSKTFDPAGAIIDGELFIHESKRWPRCRTCQHFRPDPDQPVGHCRAVGHWDRQKSGDDGMWGFGHPLDGRAAVTVSDHAEWSGLRPRPDFGCVLHEEHGATEGA